MTDQQGLEILPGEQDSMFCVVQEEGLPAHGDGYSQLLKVRSSCPNKLCCVDRGFGETAQV